MITKTDIELGLHCLKHGAQANDVETVEYADGDSDIYCWCGRCLAIVRGGKMYVPGGDENDN